MKRKLLRLFHALRHPEKLKKYLRWLAGMTRPFWLQLTVLVAIDLLAVLIGFGSSFVSKHVVDSATGGLEFLPALSVMILLSAVSIGVGALVNVLRTLINERFAFGIRLKVFDRILSANYLGLSRYHSGDLLTRLTSDVDTIASGVASSLPALAMIFVRLGAAFVLLYGYSPFLAVSALILAPVGLLLSLLTGEKLKKLSAEVKEAEASYRSFIQEHLANITVVKAFCREDGSRQRLSELRGRTLRAVLRRNRLSVLTNLCIRAVFSLGYFLSFGYCVFGLAGGTLTYGTMTLFLSLFAQIQQPLMSLSHLLPQAIGVLASAGRVMEMEEIPEEPRTGMTHTDNEVSLRFDHVDFAYDHRRILHDVSFTAAPHQLVGVMGPSGAGKTTLIRLALALVTPTAGRVSCCAGGLEETVSADSRRHIAYVPQGNTLLSGTIADNLRFGDPEATEDAMWEALDRAAAGFVRELPEGLHTVIGEKASGLSEGQAQRIAIARALLRRTPVLILDEATSALDAASEEKILSGLSGTPHDSAPLCLIITHRRSMLPYFDQLIEIGEDGRAVVSRPGKTA
ncbi:MAG: ABC transporter ATP-binding protein [Clostridia bacterium]|nr:ABC transporter ATP-binding protein [Clostridia bacterium]